MLQNLIILRSWPENLVEVTLIAKGRQINIDYLSVLIVSLKDCNAYLKPN